MSRLSASDDASSVPAADKQPHRVLSTALRAFFRNVRWRHRFSVVAVLAAVVLFAWGGFVTSIDAGLAVPDWPSTFFSYDPFTPFPEWWTVVPILAEHGHRLMGALIGLLTMALAAWTWFAERRSWMRRLGLFALALVIAQGVLGGLRVVWVSLNLAIVHACVAQIFFSLLVALTLFTSRGWLIERDVLPLSASAERLRKLVIASALAVYAQIILGALLRHPGAGINPMLAGFHMAGAFAVTGLLIYTGLFVHRRFAEHQLILRASLVQLGILALQFALGFTAYFVLLDERGMVRPSNVQVIINTSHLVVGALLMASTVVLALLALRRPSYAGGDGAPAEPVPKSKPLHAAG